MVILLYCRVNGVGCYYIWTRRSGNPAGDLSQLASFDRNMLNYSHHLTILITSYVNLLLHVSMR